MGGVVAKRFPIRFTGANKALALLGLTPGRSWVEVGDGRLRVRMGWAFHLDVPLEHVRSAARREVQHLDRGPHGAALRRVLLERRRDEDADPLVRRQDR